ncbi:hypothetical protein [Neisseria iguanae]|nr:hypothetical protein [Neisseria iguanae]
MAADAAYTPTEILGCHDDVVRQAAAAEVGSADKYSCKKVI